MSWACRTGIGRPPGRALAPAAGTGATAVGTIPRASTGLRAPCRQPNPDHDATPVRLERFGAGHGG
jgi:hypothetical protein